MSITTLGRKEAEGSQRLGSLRYRFRETFQAHHLLVDSVQLDFRRFVAVDEFLERWKRSEDMLKH